MCPVRAECLRDNISVPYGVFGGATPLERVDILIVRGRIPREWRGWKSAVEILRYYHGPF